MIRHDSPHSSDLVTRAYHRIRDFIISGRLAPGTRIIENELADLLEISRTPVRSALHRLQQEGWVNAGDTGRQLRLTVSALTRDDARDLYQIIGTLEGLAAARAAALPQKQRSTLLADLVDLNTQLRAEATGLQPDPLRVFQLHSSFHTRLVEGIGAPRVLALHRAIKPQADRYRRMYSTALIPLMPDAASEHDALIRAIDSGSADKAEEATRLNWLNAADRISRIIDIWGEKGSWSEAGDDDAS